MRIGIDYTAGAWQGAGIGRYTRELVRAILRAGAEHSYILFYASGGIEQHHNYLNDLRQLCTTYPYVRAAPIPLRPRRLTQIWQRLRIPLPVELFTGRLDIMHAPDFVLPPTRARTILTIHDLSFLAHPECAAPGMVRYLSQAVPRALRRANLVLADSEWTCRDLMHFLNTDPGQVVVIYPGVDPKFCALPEQQLAPVRKRLGLDGKFLLFVSTIEPRKNLIRLLEAFERSRVEERLVIAGRRGWLYEGVFAAIERLGLDNRVQLLDFVDDNDLPAVYNLAWAFVYPSIYEGFGLPALEAMACGTPVLTAANSSLLEVVGDAAVLVEAENVDSIADGIAAIVADEQLRTRLRTAGPLRAQLFSWEQAAQQVLGCYRRVGLGS